MRSKLTITLLSTLLALAPLTASATRTQPVKDPARWYIEDKTPQARFQTSMKEVNAAYQEALVECKKKSSPEKSACLQEARKNFQADMAAAKMTLKGAQSESEFH